MRAPFFVSSSLSAILLGAVVTLAALPVSMDAFPAPAWMQGGHAARITGVSCSADGTMIVSASEDGTIKLWSTNGALLRTLTVQPCPITAVALSPDGRKIAGGGYASGAAGNGLTFLWQAASGWTSPGVSMVRVTTNRYGRVNALAFSSDSTKLVSGCDNGSNIVTSVANGSVLAMCSAYLAGGRPAAVSSVTFSSASWVLRSLASARSQTS